MNFGPCANFGPKFEFQAFYNFGPPGISPTRLTSNVSGHGPRAKPMGRHDPKFNRVGPFRARVGSGRVARMYTYYTSSAITPNLSKPYKCGFDHFERLEACTYAECCILLRS
jgi:hypothetical protein